MSACQGITNLHLHVILTNILDLSLNYDPYHTFAGLTEPNFKTDIWRFFRDQYKGP